MTVAAQQDHRNFLNRYYGVSRHVYDLTRRYYLLGRERGNEILTEDTSWSTLLEIGPGTGRNLRKIREQRPNARFGGLEASDEMLRHARGKCPWAQIEQGFAEEADLISILGERPDRILFSYCLSMVQDVEGALENARRALAPDGYVLVADFGQMTAWNEPFKGWMNSFLQKFHVNPLDESRLPPDYQHREVGLGGYWVVYRYGPLA